MGTGKLQAIMVSLSVIYVVRLWRMYRDVIFHSGPNSMNFRGSKLPYSDLEIKLVDFIDDIHAPASPSSNSIESEFEI